MSQGQVGGDELSDWPRARYFGTWANQFGRFRGKYYIQSSVIYNNGPDDVIVPPYIHSGVLNANDQTKPSLDIYLPVLDYPGLNVENSCYILYVELLNTIATKKTLRYIIVPRTEQSPFDLATYDSETEGPLPRFIMIRGTDGRRGPQGEEGPAGTSYTIVGSVATPAALPTGLTSADIGKAWKADSTNHIYVWSVNGFIDLGAPAQGPQGPPGIATSVLHNQVVPLATWTMSHTFPNPPPVSVLVPNQTGGYEQVFANIEYPDSSSVTVTFASPEIGKVIA